MKKIKKISLSLASASTAMLLSLSMHANANVSEQLTEKREAYITAMKTENSTLITHDYANDARLITIAMPTVIGKTNAKKYFDRLFSRFDITAYKRIQTDLIEMDNHWAEIGSFELDMKNSEGKLYQLLGKYVCLWTNKNGHLSRVADAWNLDKWVDHQGELSLPEVPSTVEALEPHLLINTPVLFELAAYGALSDITVPLRDSKVLAQFYTNDALVLGNYRPVIRGMGEIQTYWDIHVNELPGFEKLQSRTNKVIDLGEYVIQFSSHIANWRLDQNSRVSTGKHLRIWQRKNNGGLKTRVLISAYDQ